MTVRMLNLSLSPCKLTFAHPVPLASLAIVSRQRTCPQLSIVGGFSSVPCSFETGQAKVL